LRPQNAAELLTQFGRYRRVLTSVALVLIMTLIPSLGLFYGGMVRKKNVGNTVITSFAATCLFTARSCSDV
jgi:ammonia channel protein AmtB